ncbi:hypothetical protein JCM10207_005329 [Rhodosporidiobolus poonsookiae]
MSNTTYSMRPPDAASEGRDNSDGPSPPPSNSELTLHDHDALQGEAPPAMLPGDVRALQDSKSGKAGASEGEEGRDAEVRDLEAGQQRKVQATVDVEHVEVVDDPRQWSNRRKNLVLSAISWTAIGATLTGSIFFPALESLQADLRTSDTLLALGVSLFILGQGVFPMCWSAISEVFGRKYCYFASLAIYIVGSIVCSRAQSIAVFLVMRVIQSLGSSAVLSLGAGTLADMYDTHERGTKLGIFYACPLLGPAAGPLIGGGITSGSSWRATFYFLTAYGGACLLLMVWLPDTFRKERSLAWRKAYERSKQHQREALAKARATLPKEVDAEKATGPATTFSPALPTPSRAEQPSSGFSPLNKVRTALSAKSAEVKVKISFRDLNPLAVSGDVLKQPANFLLITFSGFLFAAQYCITFTASRTFAATPYDYTPIEVGLVLLSFGLGNVLGSVGGGRYSDFILAKLKAKNGGKGEAEMRLKSTYFVLPFVPGLFTAYGWLAYYHTHIAGPVVVLFFLGAAIMVIYASTLAYIVDANPGRSTSAIACNSLFRGALACAASQAAEPILDHIKNGAFYTGWGVLLLLGELLLVFISIRGQRMREASREKEERATQRQREKREARLGAMGGGGKA